MIKIINGNILDAPEDIIVQQVNCMGVMGAGLAKQIRSKYPKVYMEYKRLLNWCKREYEKGFAAKEYPLGSIQFVDCDDGKVIANIFGQLHYGRDKQYTDYDALRRGFNGLYESVTWTNNQLCGSSIAIPYGIGCGLAGGDWSIVYKIIEEVFQNYDVTIYKFGS